MASKNEFITALGSRWQPGVQADRKKVIFTCISDEGVPSLVLYRKNEEQPAAVLPFRQEVRPSDSHHRFQDRQERYTGAKVHQEVLTTEAAEIPAAAAVSAAAAVQAEAAVSAAAAVQAEAAAAAVAEDIQEAEDNMI